MELEELVMGMNEKRDFRKPSKWVFKITVGCSSFTAYITEEASFEEEEEEDHFLNDSPAEFPGEKLAGTGGDLAGKGR